MRSVFIRKVSVEDVDAICTICSNDLGYPCGLPLAGREIEKRADGCGSVYVAVVDGMVKEQLRFLKNL